ncbi:hypothetical protein [Streptomyces sp. NPDC101149]|uniref:hypothetical protein n=1 Tax=Streptomyces sp. NPDC101149 TaxID=3366113 RepID=UPI00380BA417
MTAPELGEEDYLREIERLAHRVSVEAFREGWVCLPDDPEDATPLQASVNALARTLRSYHFPGDGCTQEDRPLTRLVGAAVFRPQVMPAGVQESYEEACARLGVAPRPEGWALWNTWGEGDLEVTLVVSAIETTEGLLENWSRGRSVDPVSPLPSQIALVRRGWIGPMTLAPRAARRAGLAGPAGLGRPGTCLVNDLRPRADSA